MLLLALAGCNLSVSCSSQSPEDFQLVALNYWLATPGLTEPDTSCQCSRIELPPMESPNHSGSGESQPMKRMSTKIDVPCNGCTLCCQRDLVRLEPSETAEEYLTVSHPFIACALMLAHKLNGECIYLESGGCRIHDHAPSLCRSADCRSMGAKYDFDTARRLHAMHLIDIRVWDHGRLLLERSARLQDKHELPRER